MTVSQLQQQHQLHRLLVFNGKSGTKLTFAIAAFAASFAMIAPPPSPPPFFDRHRHLLNCTDDWRQSIWQSWRRTLQQAFAAFSTDPPAESPIILPKNRGGIVKIANKKR